MNISAGTYSLGVFATTGGWNLNWVEVVSNTPPGPAVQLYQHCNYGGLTRPASESAATRWASFRPWAS